VPETPVAASAPHTINLKALSQWCCEATAFGRIYRRQDCGYL